MDSTIDSGDQKVLDPAQVQRISAVHRGFLYQHLYAVGCLLTVGNHAGAVTIIEQDEDIEVQRDGVHHYIQVKTRERPLQPADISDVLERFDQIRSLHASGERDGKPSFWIVANIELGPTLAAATAKPDWPADVRLCTPTTNSSPLPTPWPDVASGLQWTSSEAAKIPFGALPAETLIWKLAARVAHAAMGGNGRSFLGDDLSALFEQFVVQLQDFPESPWDYRPQIDEPPLVSDQRVRIITGFSGAGKTSWASQAAMHSSESVVYLDVIEAPEASIGPNLARELVARFLGGKVSEIGGAQLAQSSGLDLLRACDRRLLKDEVEVTVVMDNCHRMGVEAQQALIAAAPHLKFVFLGRPSDKAATLGALTGTEPESLKGWGNDEIAAEFRSAGAPVAIEEAERISNLTGGLPLYVRNAAAITARDYRGSAQDFCDSIQARAHDALLAQELILSDAFTALGSQGKQVAGMLSLVDVPLSRGELDQLGQAIGLDRAIMGGGLRELRALSFISTYQGQTLALHDAVRTLAGDALDLLGDRGIEKILNALLPILTETVAKSRDVGRLNFMYRVLPRIGRVDVLVDLAGDERFYEQGDPRSLRAAIEGVANDESQTIQQRFWAHDALAYWESRDGGEPDPSRLKLMRSLLDEANLPARDHINLISKEMLSAASSHDLQGVVSAFQRTRGFDIEAKEDRSVRYNFAMSLFRVPAYARAAAVLETLIAEYYGALGIKEGQLQGLWMAKLHDAMPREYDRDECKRLADALNLAAIIAVKREQLPFARRLDAMRLYSLGFAPRSAISTGMELVDDFLDIMGDAQAAIDVFEGNLLRQVRENQLTDMVLAVRSLYAVALAWGGRTLEAQREMATLREYSGSPQDLEMLRVRAELIRDIAAGRRRIIPKSIAHIRQRQATLQRSIGTVGRNEKCPCGSGVKFKHCHGP